MSSRDLGFVALGRFLVVERYREACPTSPASQVRRGRLDTPGSGSGTRAPERRPRQWPPTPRAHEVSS